MRDFAQVKGSGRIDLEIARFALEALNIDQYGLDEIDNKILCTIIDKFKGGPVGLTTIATALGEDPGTLEEVYEPFLIKEGFLKRTPRGREVTELAYKHLGKVNTIAKERCLIDKHYGRNKIFGKGYCHLWTEQYRRTFLNYLLVPLYTAVLPAASGGYGVVSNVYAYTALILVLLTFGMETGFFRFANKSDEDAQKVYANSLLFVGGLSLLFVVLCMVFLHPLSALLEYPDHPDYIAMMVCVVALDSFQCIPFAYLRYKKRPVKFAAIKLLNIIGNILLNLFFLLVCPWLDVHAHETVSWFYNPDYLVGYISCPT